MENKKLPEELTFEEYRELAGLFAKWRECRLGMIVSGALVLFFLTVELFAVCGFLLLCLSALGLAVFAVLYAFFYTRFNAELKTTAGKAIRPSMLAYYYQRISGPVGFISRWKYERHCALQNFLLEP